MTLPAPDSPGMKGAEYASNKGCGPLVARVINESCGVVYMERWNPRTKYPVRTAFTLPTRFIEQSGWKKIGGGT